MATHVADSKLWWAVPAAALLLLTFGVMLFGNQREEQRRQSSYDASDRGFRAAYLLLEELGYPVQRSRRLGGTAVRWVLFPSSGQKEAPQLNTWVRDGGILLLADKDKDWAQQMGITLEVRKTPDAGTVAASGIDVGRLDCGTTLVDWPGHSGDVLVQAGGKPVVTRYDHGRGEIWLLNRPEIVTNQGLRRADNAVLVCRLASQMLDEHAGKIAFDEFFHGMRDRPDVTTLLFEPPTLWITLQALGLLVLVLWRYAPRFGTLRSVVPTSRRSKEEFLDALAYLLERKQDYEEAYAAVRDAFRRQLETELGLPVGTPDEQLIAEAVARRPIRPGRMRRVLTGKELRGRHGSKAFLDALNELETARHELSLR